MMNARAKLVSKVINAGLCVGCRAFVSKMPRTEVVMVRRGGDVAPGFSGFSKEIDDLFWEACPGKGVDYPRQCRTHYGRLPDDWRIGIARRVFIGHSKNPEVRSAGASGGVMMSVLLPLLDSGKIDAAVFVRQGIPTSEEAAYYIARSREEILSCAQSVYVPVSVLDTLRDFLPDERYVMTYLPEQSTALRVLQHNGIREAEQVVYVLGPETGTILDYRAIRVLLRRNGVNNKDHVMSINGGPASSQGIWRS